MSNKTVLVRCSTMISRREKHQFRLSRHTVFCHSSTRLIVVLFGVDLSICNLPFPTTPQPSKTGFLRFNRPILLKFILNVEILDSKVKLNLNPSPPDSRTGFSEFETQLCQIEHFQNKKVAVSDTYFLKFGIKAE